LLGGAPPVKIRRRFDDRTVEELLRIAWWRWPIERIRESFDLLNCASAGKFVWAIGC
jgi:virginiamycin A acetyltransferase